MAIFEHPSPEWHVAEINVARTIAPLGDPIMADFVRQLDAVNQLAEQSPGFIWRLTADDGGASSYIRFDADERVIVNMSVWISIEALKQYVYRSAHGAVYRDRRRWFEPATTPSVALWWIRAGQIPSLEDGRRRLERLTSQGPTVEAFTFKEWFDPPGVCPSEIP